MSPPDASGPTRTCVGCRRRRPTGALVRITWVDGEIGVGGPSAGRGAWLCADDERLVDPACLEQAIGKRAFARAWRRDVDRDTVARIRRRLGAADETK